MFRRPPSDLRVAIESARPLGTYAPGDEVTMTIKTTDKTGAPVPAALAVTVLDESVRVDG